MALPDAAWTLVRSIELTRRLLCKFDQQEIKTRILKANLQARLLREESSLRALQPAAQRHLFENFDVMTQIFSFATYLDIQSYPVPVHLQLNTKVPTPMAIASVCASWRSICLRCPRIWSVIYIKKDKNKNKIQLARRVRLYLKRSLPLDVDVSFHWLSPVRLVDDWKDLLSPLFSSQDRWRRASFQIPPSAYFDLFPLTAAKHLEELRMDISSADVPPNKDFEFIASSAPKLRYLSVGDEFFGEWDEDGAPWEQLVKLNFTGSTDISVELALLVCTNLQVLRLFLDDIPDFDPCSNIVHEKIHTLILHDAFIYLDLGTATFPALTTLIVQVPSSGVPGDGLFELLQKFSSLRKFTIQLIFLTEPECLESLLPLACSTLTTLRFDFQPEKYLPPSFLPLISLDHLMTHFPALETLCMDLSSVKHPEDTIQVLLLLANELDTLDCVFSMSQIHVYCAKKRVAKLKDYLHPRLTIEEGGTRYIYEEEWSFEDPLNG